MKEYLSCDENGKTSFIPDMAREILNLPLAIEDNLLHILSQLLASEHTFSSTRVALTMSALLYAIVCTFLMSIGDVFGQHYACFLLTKGLQYLASIELNQQCCLSHILSAYYSSLSCMHFSISPEPLLNLSIEIPRACIH